MCVFYVFFSSSRQGGTGTPTKSRMEVQPNAMEAGYLLSMPRRRSFPVWSRGCGRGARGCCSQWGEDEGGVPRCGQLSGVWGLGRGEEDVSVCCRERRGCWCGCRPGWSVFPVGLRFNARLRHRGRRRASGCSVGAHCSCCLGPRRLCAASPVTFSPSSIVFARLPCQPSPWVVGCRWARYCCSCCTC